jgi:mannose-6-phosphate isomerase-like protein (cupin superfamily)
MASVQIGVDIPVERFYDARGDVMAIVVRSPRKWSGPTKGLHFFTKEEDNLQVARFDHPAGYVIDPHIHNKEMREVQTCSEVLYIEKGELEVTLYDVDETQTFTVNVGDILILLSGGHGFNILSEVNVVYVKQGPYIGERDKRKIEKRDSPRSQTIPKHSSTEGP